MLFGIMVMALLISVVLHRDNGGATPAAGGPTAAAREQEGDAPPQGTGPVVVTAVGDIMMGAEQTGLPPNDGAGFFDNVVHLLDGDVVLGNLEGTLSAGGESKCAPNTEDCFAFQTPPAYAQHLADAGFNVLNLANNHAHDFGAEGITQTVAALRGVGIQPTGLTGTEATTTARTHRIITLGFAPYDWADPLLDIPAAQERVRQAASRASIVVVTFHGGAEGLEADSVPAGAETQDGEQRGDLRAFTRAMVDAGADLVVGHGPHVLRGMEVHNGRLIAYSLGNFAGYRAFTLGGMLSTSAVLQTTLNADGSLRAARIRPTSLIDDGIPADGVDAINVIRDLSQQDFPDSAPRISAEGVVTARPAAPPATSTAPAEGTTTEEDQG